MTLRSPELKITLWIDAVCINQSDRNEKTWQVDLMRFIYQQAYKVFAWLGPASVNSSPTMKYLNRLGKRALDLRMEDGNNLHANIWEHVLTKPSKNLDLFRKKFKGRIPRNGFLDIVDLFYSISGWHDQDDLLPIEGIRELFNRPYWGRIWILQEVALQENSDLIWGAESITQRRMAAALVAYLALWGVIRTRLLSHLETITPYHYNMMFSISWVRPNVMLNAGKIFRAGGFQLTALLLATCVGSVNLHRHGPHHLEATDPRDKIFALLSIARDREELRALGVFPDYSKSCKEIYTATMTALLRQGHVSLLSFNQTPKLQSDLPSWVPDWSQSVTDRLQDVEPDHITQYPRFSASGSNSCPSGVTVVMQDGAIEGISVAGCTLDEVIEMGTFPNRLRSNEVPLSETESWPVVWLGEILRLVYRRRRHHTDFAECLRAAVRTSIGEVGHGYDTTLARVGDDRFQDALTLLQNGLNHIKDREIKRALQHFISEPQRTDVANTPTSQFGKFDTEIIGKSLGRLPAITKKGYPILSYDYVQPGDLVAIIQGMQVPVIIRHKHRGRYVLVGEAYVDGIMDGEAMDKSVCSNILLI